MDDLEQDVTGMTETEDHDNLHKNFESMNIMDNCYEPVGGNNTPFGTKPTGSLIDMFGGNKMVGDLVNSFANAMNTGSQRTTRLTGNVNGANFSIDITNEFSCKMAMDILRELAKGFKNPPTPPPEPEPPIAESNTIENSC